MKTREREARELGPWARGLWSTWPNAGAVGHGFSAPEPWEDTSEDMGWGSGLGGDSDSQIVSDSAGSSGPWTVSVVGSECSCVLAAHLSSGVTLSTLLGFSDTRFLIGTNVTLNPSSV